VEGAFTINGSSIIVHIRGLTMWGVGTGITFLNGSALYVENCIMFNDDANGIVFESSAAAKLFISNSTIRNNGNAGTVAGIHVVPASGVQANVTIEHSRIEGNYFGIIADSTQGGTNGVIRGSVVSNNVENGITASTTSSNVLLIIDQTEVAGNLHGLVAGGGTAAIMARNTTVTGNTVGLFTVNGGQLFSYGNNSVDGNNGNNGAFTGPATLK
jgi:hypothetical protein